MNASRYLRFVRRGLVRSGPPLHLTLFVTGRCNLRCRHCFHWKEVAAGAEGPPLEAIERLAASTERMGPLLWLSLGGGEPFLRDDLAAVAGAFGRRGLRHLAIPTNGLVARTEEVLERVLVENPETYVSVAVSIDGPPQVHDAIRALEGAHARATAAVGRLARLRERHANLGVGVILTVTAENQDVLAEHLEELVDRLAPDNVTLNLARGDALDRDLLAVDPDRYRAVVDTKRRLLKEGRLGTFDFPLARLALARDLLTYEHVERVARGRSEPHHPCTAGTLSAVVFEDGSVHPCEVLGESIGNLHEHDWDLARLWESARAAELRRKIRDTRCSCTWECAQSDNVLFRPASWPRLALEAVRS